MYQNKRTNKTYGKHRKNSDCTTVKITGKTIKIVAARAQRKPPQSEPIPFTEWLEKLRKEVERARDGKFLNRKIVKERA